MKTNDRFKIYDTNGDEISVAIMINDINFSIFDKEVKYISYGKFIDQGIFNIYDLNEDFISCGDMTNLDEFDIFDKKGTPISLGKRNKTTHINS